MVIKSRMRCIYSVGKVGEFQRLERTVEGLRVQSELFFRLYGDRDDMVLVAGRDAVAREHPAAQAGHVCAGLWRYDCVELFLSGEEDGRYVEMNLSPGGAWWASSFLSPRVAAPEGSVETFDNRGIRASGECTENGWKAQLRVPLRLLTEHGVRLTNCRAAVCATLIGNTGERQFLASSPVPSDPPNFHCPELWEELWVRTVQ